MKITNELKNLITSAIKDLSGEMKGDPIIERPKVKEHGDYSTNIAMLMATSMGMKPRELAEKLSEKLAKYTDVIEKVTIAGPGFINFVLKKSVYLAALDDIYKEGADFGRLTTGKGKKAQVEFVSANPTGPLHVGHGRGAVYGDTLANVLSWAGYKVTKEYYLNDAGNQMMTLGKSLYLRIRELEGEMIEFPPECYQGHYMVDIAREVIAHKDFPKLKKMEEKDAIFWCGQYAGTKILEEIKTDMRRIGIVHDTYYSELSLYNNGAVEKTMKELAKRGYSYESEGALWFKSTEFGDEKDRVLKKGTGEFTYFATDIAYHVDKFKRGFDRVIDVWGADHGGHITRMKGSMKAMGLNPDALDVVLIQLVNLIRGGEMVSMSTRSATYETLSQLIDDVGSDVCRYFFLMRSHNAQLDFDIELARKHSPENPVFYIQYAHARIASIFRRAEEQGTKFDHKKRKLELLDLDEEIRLASLLAEFPTVIHVAAESLEPHKISFYLLELAKMFQSYYTKAKADDRYKVLVGNEERVQSKLYLLKNIQIVIKNGLSVLGINAPEEMIREETDAGL